MVKHIRKPGIKADFTGKSLKLGSALLPLPLQMSGHKQTQWFTWESPALPGSREGNSSWPLETARSSLAWPTACDGWGRRQSGADPQAPAKPSTGCKGAWPAHSGCKRQEGNNKQGLSSSGPLTGSSLLPSGFWLPHVPQEQLFSSVCSMIFTPLESIGALNPAHKE